MDCPSGRLTVVAKGKSIEPDFPAEIAVIEDEPAEKMGPLWVRGGIEIECEDGRGIRKAQPRYAFAAAGNP